MTGADLAAAIAAAGGLSGVAALISALAAFRTSKQAHTHAQSAAQANEVIVTELRPNHGSSLRDAIDQLDRKTDLLAEEVTLLARTQDQTLALVRDRLNAHRADIEELQRERTRNHG